MREGALTVNDRLAVNLNNSIITDRRMCHKKHIHNTPFRLEKLILEIGVSVIIGDYP